MRNHDSCYDPWDMVWEHTELFKKCKTCWSNVGCKQKDPNLIWIPQEIESQLVPEPLNVGFRENWSDNEFTLLIQRQSPPYFLQAAVFPYSQRGTAGESQISKLTVSFKGSGHPGRRGWLLLLCLCSTALCITIWTSPSHGNRSTAEVQVLWDEPCNWHAGDQLWQRTSLSIEAVLFWQQEVLILVAGIRCKCREVEIPAKKIINFFR